MKKIYHIAVAIFGAALWLFFALCCYGQLHSVEGDSLFLFTGEFAKDVLIQKGGLSNYIGAFIVQFFSMPWLGSLILSLMLCAMALSLGRLCRSDSLLPLTLAPSAIFAVLLCDPKWTVAGAAAITLINGLAALVMRIRSKWLKIGAGLIAATISVLWILPAKFYTYLESPIWAWWLIVAIDAAIIAICSFVKTGRGKQWSTIVICAIILAGTVFGALKVRNPLDEEISRYTYMVRTSDWDGILDYSKKHSVNSPLSTNAINLALSMKGRMGDELFNYFQRGQRSLINFEERKLSSEILFHLGFVNEAIHVAFEDMACNPSRERGAYHLTRLATFTSIGERNQALSERYLETLHHTLFYRHFSPRTDGVSAEMEPSEDFFFDYGNLGRMAGTLYGQRTGNTRARDYYAASLLLDKNLVELYENFSDEEQLPRHWVEAFDLLVALNGGPVDPKLQGYVDAYHRCQGKEAGMSRYSNTYWYYHNFAR